MCFKIWPNPSWAHNVLKFKGGVPPLSSEKRPKIPKKVFLHNFLPQTLLYYVQNLKLVKNQFSAPKTPLFGTFLDPETVSFFEKSL